MRYLLFILFVIVTFPCSLLYAEDPPFEVVKTQMIESALINGEFIDYYYYDGNTLMSTNHEEYPKGYPVEWYTENPIYLVKGYYYTLEFWNIGAMGYLGAYADAKLTIAPNVVKTYFCEKIHASTPFYDDGRLVCLKTVSTSGGSIPGVSIDLKFTGGPYGKFTTPNGSNTRGTIVDGSSISISAPYSSQEVWFQENIGGVYTTIPIKGDGFVKWMEILNNSGDCSDPSNPKTDSGVRFSDIWGRVQVVSCNDYIDEAWMSAVLDMTLYVEDHIKTVRDYSGAVLSLQDMTTFKMQSNTEIVLSNPPEKESKIKLIAGKVWANVQRMVKDGSMEVEMSEAVAGIKGTTFVAEETAAGSRLKVIEGVVEFTSKATGEMVNVSAGEAVQATSSGMDSKVSFDVKQEIANWDNMTGEYIETTSFCPALNAGTFNINIPFVAVGGFGYQAELIFDSTISDGLYWKLDASSLQSVSSSCTGTSQCAGTTTSFDLETFKLSLPCITVNGLIYKADLLYDPTVSSSEIYWKLDNDSLQLADGYVVF